MGSVKPNITFHTYTDANNDVSFFADMKFDVTFKAGDDPGITSWYVDRWAKVAKYVERFEKQVFTL